jgi:hypothetical protein
MPGWLMELQPASSRYMFASWRGSKLVTDSGDQDRHDRLIRLEAMVLGGLMLLSVALIVLQHLA